MTLLHADEKALFDLASLQYPVNIKTILLLISNLLFHSSISVRCIKSEVVLVSPI